MTPIATYAIKAPPGPAVEIEEPLATNKPVPIDPPSAIMDRWRVFNDLFMLLSFSIFNSPFWA